jgi:hypothetical protein
MADDTAPVIEKPGKESLHLPPSFVAPQLASVLCFGSCGLTNNGRTGLFQFSYISLAKAGFSLLSTRTQSPPETLAEIVTHDNRSKHLQKKLMGFNYYFKWVLFVPGYTI